MLNQTTIERTTSLRQPAGLATAKGSKAFHSSIDLMGGSIPFGRNAEIYGENEPADHFYKVLSGAVRTYKVLSDGRRQIGDFYFPGEIFGFEAGADHKFSAESIDNSKILVIRRSALIALAARDHEAAHQLWAMTAGELQRAQNHVMLLIKTAQERVVRFLLDMAIRSANTSEVDLPMSRQDIADYLGLTIETVSRILRQLQDGAAIEVPTSRRIVLRNRTTLKRLNASRS